MAMQAYEFKAKSVDDAINEGLKTLNVSEDDVDIEVVNKGSRGLFGIGSEPALIRISLRPITPPVAPEEPAEDTFNKTVVETIEATIDTEIVGGGGVADNADEENIDADLDEVDEAASESIEQSAIAIAANAEDLSGEDEELAALAADMLDEMIHLMGFDAEVITSWQEDDDDFEDDKHNSRSRYLLLDVEGTDLGALIGRRGETLENMQYLLRLMINQKIHQWKNVVIDVEHYKARRVTQVSQLADRMAEQVARTGKAISLEPMPANERRIVHMVLRNHPDVYTESYGEGSRRKVHIVAND